MIDHKSYYRFHCLNLNVHQSNVLDNQNTPQTSCPTSDRTDSCRRCVGGRDNALSWLGGSPWPGQRAENTLPLVLAKGGWGGDRGISPFTWIVTGPWTRPVRGPGFITPPSPVSTSKNVTSHRTSYKGSKYLQRITDCLSPFICASVKLRYV